MTSYSDAGVDVAAGDRFVESIAATVTKTWGDNVIGGFGGFAAGITLPEGYDDPVLMMTTDGVGTKLELARLLDRWGGVGFDLVAMCVDDLAAAGAAPLGFTDYLAVAEATPERDRLIVESIAAACEEAGCALLGGETAVHPGVMPPGSVDLAGAALGVSERHGLLHPDRVEAGDALVGVASPNVRSNGFSLVRAIFAEADYATELPELGKTLGAVLLEPSVIYAPVVLEIAAEYDVKAMAHITGGGLAGNVARVLPAGLSPNIDRATWEPPAIFAVIRQHGDVPDDDMYATFNMGIGFVLIVPVAHAHEVVAALGEDGHDAAVVGTVTA